LDEERRTPATLDNGRPHLSRVLGRADLIFFLIAAEGTLNNVPVAAGMGPVGLHFWVAGSFLFVLPQGVAVLELSRRPPQEEGTCKRNKSPSGNFQWVVSGVSYRTMSIFFLSTLLFYLVGLSTFTGGLLSRGRSALCIAAVDRREEPS
jgi:hypothetical protein